MRITPVYVHYQNFRKLLLHKCQEEFENRRRATAAFTGRDGLSPEEEEQMAVAKRKMLGNIKFVGEYLGECVFMCVCAYIELSSEDEYKDVTYSVF